MNRVFFGIVLIAFVTAAFTGQMEAVSTAAFASAKASVELAIGLIGYMALFLGIMRVAQDGGLLRLLAKAIRPIMIRLFPGVPEDHPAMGAMILNIASNMLGLGNAATPFGIKAMKELNKLNARPGVATNAMVLFLAINTSSVALLPTGVVSVRAVEGSLDPWGIVAPSLVATLLSTLVGIFVAISLGRSRMFAAESVEASAPVEDANEAIPEQEEADSPSPEIQGPEPTTLGVRILACILLLGVGLLVVPPVWSAFLPGESVVQELRESVQEAEDEAQEAWVSLEWRRGLLEELVGQEEATAAKDQEEAEVASALGGRGAATAEEATAAKEEQRTALASAEETMRLAQEKATAAMEDFQLAREEADQAAELRAFSDTVGDWVIPVLIVTLLGFGAARGVRVYESFVEGAKEGFDIGVKIIPFLVAILVAVGMFRASGAMTALTGFVGPFTAALGLPGEVVPMALVRPLSGSGAFGLMSEILHTHGPDTYIGYVASVLQGSTETTFYVLAVYFGAVGITRVRHAVVAGLSADLAGVLAAAIVCKALFGHLI